MHTSGKFLIKTNPDFHFKLGRPSSSYSQQIKEVIEKAGSTQSLCDSFYVFLAASSRFLVLTINKEYILHSAKMLNCVGGKNGKKYSIIFLLIANKLWVPISDIELGLGGE